MKRALQNNLRGLTTEEFQILQSLCHISKNLYNETLYTVRQHFFNNGEYLNYYNTYKQLKNSDNYKLLPSQVAQQTMKHVDKAFQSFFKLLQKKKAGKYDSKVSIPHYKPKDGKYILDFPNQMFQVKSDYIRIGVPKKFREEFDYDIKEIRIPFTYDKVRSKTIKRLTILPRNNFLQYRLVYEVEKDNIDTDPNTFLSIDCGVSNLATCVNQSGRSFILDGRRLKDINRWYNKNIARLKSIKDKQGIEESTRQLTSLFHKRKNRVNDYLNKAVNFLITYCKQNRVGTILVGDARGWKQRSNLGDSNNQNFVSIPFNIFKQKLKGKCELYGIDFDLVNESYTSKCSFLDDEDINKHEKYCGKRVHRGLFKSSKGVLINADLNAALNIAKKYFKNKGKPEILKRVRSSGTVDVPSRIREPFEMVSI